MYDETDFEKVWCIGNVRAAVEAFALGKKESARAMSVVPEQVELFEKIMVQEFADS